VLAVVSPTCDDCRAGLRLVRDAVGERRAVSLFVLWVGMLVGDTAEVASGAAEQVGHDTQVWHYWEEEGWPVSTRLRSVLRRPVRPDAKRVGRLSVVPAGRWGG
jgi:hypothetical protein